MNNTIGDLHGSTCWIENNDEESSNLFIIGGCNYDKIPNYSLFKLTLDKDINIVSMEVSKDEGLKGINSQIIPIYSAVARVDELLFVFGGVLYDEIMGLGPKIKNWETGLVQELSYREELDVFGASVVHFEREFFLFGGRTSAGDFKSENGLRNTLVRIDLEQLKIRCSDGHVGNLCEPCGPGTYEKNHTCVKCAKGTFNEVYGASFEQQCIPCPYGTYSPEQGSSKCFQCPSGSSCPIGSSSPSPQIILTSNHSYQPSDYKNSKQTILKVNLIMMYSFLSFVLFFSLISYFWKNFLNKIQFLDLFSSQHNYGLGIPVVYKKTRIGGLLSLIFLLFVVTTLCEGILLYIYDNVSEIKEMIPLVMINDDVDSSFVEISNEVMGYGGECVEKGVCSEDIEISEIGLVYKSREIDCKSVSNNCFIKILYKNVKLDKKISNVYIHYKESLSFANAISLNITSHSSVPGEESEIGFTIVPLSKYYVFRGSKDCVFAFNFIPTVNCI